MLQKILTKYWLVVNIGITALAVWFVLLVSLKATSLILLLWWSLILAELFVLIPAVHKGENLSDARRRTWKTLSADAFLYFGLSVSLYLFVQWLNGGCTPVYDVNAGVWNYSQPDVKWLPYSIDQVDSLRMFNIMTAFVVIGLCIRHAAGKRSKRALLQGLSVLSGFFAVFAVWQGMAGNQTYLGFMLKSESSSMGSFFGFWLIMGIGSYADSLACRQRRTEIIYVMGILCNFAGMLFFTQLPAMIMFTLVAILVLIYTGLYLSAHVSRPFLIKFYMLTFLIIAGGLLVLFVVFPQSALTDKIGLTSDISGSWQALVESKNIRSETALQIWKEHKWFGTGAEGFQHYAGSFLNDKGWSLLKVNKGLVYNDSLQVLCEFGLLGSAIFSALLFTMLVPIFYRAHIAWSKGTHSSDAGRRYLLRVSPFFVTGVLAISCCFAESFVSSPYRFPALFVSFFIVMLSIPAFLPSK